MSFDFHEDACDTLNQAGCRFIVVSSTPDGDHVSITHSFEDLDVEERKEVFEDTVRMIADTLGFTLDAMVFKVK